MFEYRILTTIPRTFDPDVEGVTIDSIVESCKGYVSHSVPPRKGDTILEIKTSKPLEIQYLIDQLDDNFRALLEEESVVKEIVQKAGSN